MDRELRPRKARPSYAALLELEGDETQRAQVLEELEADSGSDFAPEIAVESAVEDDEEEADELDEEEGELEEKEESLPPEPKRQKGKGKDTGTNMTVEQRPKATVKLTSGLSRPSNRQMHALPTPSSNHRHRATPIFWRQGKVERLLSPPKLFTSPHATSVLSSTAHPAIASRIGKAWGYNVGPGPLWDMMEDRAWYKEAVADKDKEENERYRRPRVYRDLKTPGDIQILTRDQASLYLPSDVAATEEGNLRPPPPVSCSFGLFGKQTRRELNMFDALRISEYILRSKSHVFDAGAPVWAIDWCPLHPEERPCRANKQYLAVGPFPSRSHSPDIGAKVARPTHACIQIWSLSPSSEDVEMSDANEDENEGSEHDTGQMKCELVVCIESGPAHELKWCPLPAHDSFQQKCDATRKLGLLAGTFDDGSMSIYVIPDPDDIHSQGDDSVHPKFVKIPEPLVRIELEETSCMSLDWANSEVLAIGCTNGTFSMYSTRCCSTTPPGSIAVYDVAEAINSDIQSNILPIYYMSVHQSAVRGLAWVRAPLSSATGTPLTSEDPTVLASGGYDGLECFTDIRDPHGNVFNRTRDVISCVANSVYAGGAITIDHENIIKVFQTAPAMLGRGHMFLEPGGPVWSVGVSDYHPQLAVGCADGACSTTNTLRPTRKGGAVPFFVYKIYQMDYSRKTGEYRMLENFLPQETQDRPSATRAKKQGQTVEVMPVGTGAWPAEVGVHRTVWNSGNGLANAPLLASATGSGLCRVDWLVGRWMKDKVPYGGTEAMAETVEVDGDEEDEE
ncbi:hypothetical protein NEOLEDRAFT_1170475 [Neolentinus lepideus HHB14362 ss-1]|uniref:WD40 repeat-like protein n=1 Tax=Neolentinus lepideus HHB14362 ss-1 TaxID=1314782 RepID=A0A165RLK7_9AGAM|nr:hypothetical protein NEOLEDRAFT_1170475 [Neolentinus lepideus HHB14362 ss-1]